MRAIADLYDRITYRLDAADWWLPTLARLLFAAVLLMYFIKSGMTKLGDGISGLWTPSTGAYAQIYPKAFEAVGYDASAMTAFQKAVVLSGTLAEFILPALIVLGLFTRFAAAGMIIFVVVQSLTDWVGHGATEALGAWFDRFPDGAILDQRSLWIFLLLVLVFKGPGPLSFDRLLRKENLYVP